MPEGWLPGVNLPRLRLYWYAAWWRSARICSLAKGVKIELVPNSSQADWSWGRHCPISWRKREGPDDHLVGPGLENPIAPVLVMCMEHRRTFHGSILYFTHGSLILIFCNPTYAFFHGHKSDNIEDVCRTNRFSLLLISYF